MKFVLGSWLKPFGREFFDVIVSNPPYIDADDVHMKDLATEPEHALVADKHGLADIEQIIQQGKKHLTREWLGCARTWISDQGEAVRHLFLQAGYGEVRTVKDYGGK